MTTSRSMGMLPIFGSSFPYPPCLLSSLGDNIMCLLGFWPRSNINWAEEGEGFRLATSLKPVVSKSKTRIIFELASHRLSCWFAKMISNIGLRLFSHLTRVSNGNKQSSNLKVASCANAQRDRALRAVAMQTNASDSGVQCWKTLAGNRLQWPGRPILVAPSPWAGVSMMLGSLRQDLAMTAQVVGHPADCVSVSNSNCKCKRKSKQHITAPPTVWGNQSKSRIGALMTKGRNCNCKRKSKRHMVALQTALGNRSKQSAKPRSPQRNCKSSNGALMTQVCNCKGKRKSKQHVVAQASNRNSNLFLFATLCISNLICNACNPLGISVDEHLQDDLWNSALAWTFMARQSLWFFFRDFGVYVLRYIMVIVGFGIDYGEAVGHFVITFVHHIIFTSWALWVALAVVVWSNFPSSHFDTINLVQAAWTQIWFILLLGFVASKLCYSKWSRNSRPIRCVAYEARRIGKQRKHTASPWEMGQTCKGVFKYDDQRKCNPCNRKQRWSRISVAPVFILTLLLGAWCIQGMSNMQNTDALRMQIRPKHVTYPAAHWLKPHHEQPLGLCNVSSSVPLLHHEQTVGNWESQVQSCHGLLFSKIGLESNNVCYASFPPTTKYDKPLRTIFSCKKHIRIGEARKPGPGIILDTGPRGRQGCKNRMQCKQFCKSKADRRRKANTYTQIGQCKMGGSNSNCNNPGKQCKQEQTEQQHGFILEICNVTHMHNNLKLIKDRLFNAMLITEHSTPRCRVGDIRKGLGKGYKVHLSGLDSEKNCNVGGTACVLKANSKHIIQPKPKHPELCNLIDQGRIGLYSFEVCPKVHALFYVIYGWTGADEDKEAAARTDDLLCIAHDDMQCHPAGPKFIVGDINGTLKSFTTFHSEILEHTLFDLGEVGSAYGGIDKDVTCRATASARSTRRDYVLANSEGKDIVDTLIVDHNPCFLVHDVLRLTFKQQPLVTSYDKVDIPSPLSTIVSKVLTRDYGVSNIERAEQRKQQQEAKDGKKFVCNPTLEVDPGESDLQPVFPCKAKTSEEDRILFEQCDGDYQKLVANLWQEEEAAKFTPAQKQAVYTRLHVLMDKHLDKHSKQWSKWLAKGQTDLFYSAFSRCIETAAVELGRLDCSSAAYRGRGTVNIKSVTEKLQADYCEDTQTIGGQLTQQGVRILLQSRRLTSIRNNARALTKVQQENPQDPKGRVISAQIKDAIVAFKADWKCEDGQSHIYDAMEPTDHNNIPNFFTLSRAIDELIKRSQCFQRKSNNINAKVDNLKYRAKRCT